MNIGPQGSTSCIVFTYKVFFYISAIFYMRNLIVLELQTSTTELNSLVPCWQNFIYGNGHLG